MHHYSYMPCNLLPLFSLSGACIFDGELHSSGSTFGHTCTTIVGHYHMNLNRPSHNPPFLATASFNYIVIRGFSVT